MDGHDGSGLDRRQTLSIALLVLACLAVVGTLVTSYVRTQLLDREDFADRAVAAIQRDEVRSVVARELTINVVERGAEDAITYRPLIEQAVSVVLDTPPALRLLRLGVREAHGLLFVRDQGNVVLDVADAATVIRPALRSVAPQVADEIPSDLSPEILRLREGETGTQLLRLAGNVRTLSFVLPIVALLLLAGGILAAHDRRQAATRAGIAVGVAGVAVVALTYLGGSLAADAARGGTVVPLAEARDATGALWDVMFGDLRRWGLGLAAAGLIVAGAGASLLRPVEAAGDRLEEAVAAVLHPRSPELRALRGVAAILIGALLLVRPELAARIIALAGGAFLAFVGAGEVLDLVQEPRRRRQGGAPAPDGRRGRSWVPVAAGVAAFVGLVTVVGVALTGDDAPANPPRAAVLPGDVTTCNGAEVNCDRRLNEVVFPGTHNAFSAAEDPGWSLTNQRFGIGRQLEDGIRLLLIDVHPAVRAANGRVRTDFDAAGSSANRVRQQLDPAQLAAVERLGGRIGLGDTTGGTQGLYLCHSVCELGSTPAVDVLRDLRVFLERERGETVVLFVEPYVDAVAVQQLFAQAGLLDLVVTLDRSAPLPTLRELVADDRRLVVFTERGATPDIPWYMDGFAFVQDTPLGAKQPRDLSCAPYRGQPDSPILMLNHWIDDFPPPRGRNRAILSRKFLVDRALRCGRERRLPASFIAVDHYDLGDVIGAARELNAMPVESRTAVPDDATEVAALEGADDDDQATPALRPEAGGTLPTAGG